MKRKAIKELHGKDLKELKAKLVELQDKWTKTRLDFSLKKIKNYQLQKTLRDDMARISTVIREKELTGGR